MFATRRTRMKKAVAYKLKEAASKVARGYSRSDRDHNYSNESFEVQKIVPHSEQTATVVYLKSSGKMAAAFFYFVSAKDDWRYWFPTDSHIAGMEGFRGIKERVEHENFDKNFDFVARP